MYYLLTTVSSGGGHLPQQLSPHMGCLCPVAECLIQVQAPWLPIPASAYPKRQQRMAQVLGPYHPHWRPTWNAALTASNLAQSWLLSICRV